MGVVDTRVEHCDPDPAAVDAGVVDGLDLEVVDGLGQAPGDDVVFGMLLELADAGDGHDVGQCREGLELLGVDGHDHHVRHELGPRQLAGSGALGAADEGVLLTLDLRALRLLLGRGRDVAAQERILGQEVTDGWLGEGHGHLHLAGGVRQIGGHP